MPFTHSLLRDRDVRTAVCARAVSLLGDEAALVALQLHLHDSGAGGLAMAALLVAGLAPLVLLAPVVGPLADSRDSRRLLLVASLGQFLACLVLLTVPPLPVLLLVVAVLGAGEALAGSTWQALLPELAPPGRLPEAVGLLSSARTLAALVAPALGGLLSATLGLRVPLALDAVSYLAIALAAVRLTVRRRPRHEAAEAPRAGDGFRLLRTDAVLAPVVAALCVCILFGMVVNVVEVFLVRDTLHASGAWYGALTATWALGAAVGAPLAGRAHADLALARALFGGLVLLSAMLLLFSAVPGPAWLLPVSLLGGIGNGAANVGASALVVLRAPAEARGRVGAAVGGLTAAVSLASLALGGVLSTALAPRLVFLLSGASSLTAVLALAPAVLRRVARSAPRATQDAAGEPVMSTAAVPGS